MNLVENTIVENIIIAGFLIVAFICLVAFLWPAKASQTKDCFREYEQLHHAINDETQPSHLGQLEDAIDDFYNEWHDKPNGKYYAGQLYRLIANKGIQLSRI